MAKNTLKTSESQQSQAKGVSVISLDALKPTERLLPGETREIAKGVSISVMQSAAEALLEIQESANGSISIDNQPAHELATVRPGQIIKTIEGRYVLLRHLHAMIVPRNVGYRRPEHIDRMIALAVASLEQPVSPVLEANTNDDAVVNSPSIAATEIAGGIKSSQRKVRLAILGSAIAVVAGLCFMPLSQEHFETASGMAPHAKSRIVAAAEQAQLVVKNTGAPLGDANARVLPLGETTQATSQQPTKNISAVEALKTAMAVTANAKKSQPTRISVRRGGEDDTGGPRAVRLSEKDRQTIIEYKLEAKFDRTKARIKLKDMAKSFPAGSPARMEVERAASAL